MAFLSMVQRELLIASRRSSTYRYRTRTVMGAMIMSSLFLLAGAHMFQLLTWYVYSLTFFAGLFITSDCLSEEKRDGTLGLLFLTDLSVVDVVLGKFVAVSLNAWFCLVALFPLLAMPLLLGGTSGDEYWRTMLALGNHLFFSLAMGLLASAWGRQAPRTLGVTTLLMVLANVLGGIALALPVSEPTLVLASLSPYTAFVRADDAHYSRNIYPFWRSLAGSHCLAWACLGLACLVLPRSWMASGSRPASPGRFSARRQKKWLEENPVYWLSAGSTRWPVLVWAIVLTVLTVQAILSLWGQYPFPLPLISGLVLKITAAAFACHFFAEARQSGALELIFSTPLGNRELLRGFWRGYQRVFLLPMALLLLGNVILELSRHGVEWVGKFPMGMFRLFFLFYPILTLGMSLWALGYLGLWMSLSCRKPAMATALTVGIGVVGPLLFFCVPDPLISTGFVIWSQSKLSPGLRWLLQQSMERK